MLFDIQSEIIFDLASPSNSISSIEKDIIIRNIYPSIFFESENISNNKYCIVGFDYNSGKKFNIGSNPSYKSIPYHVINPEPKLKPKSNQKPNYKLVQSFDFENNDFYYQDQNYLMNHNQTQISNSSLCSLCAFCGKQSHGNKRCHKISYCNYCKKQGHTSSNCYDLAKAQNRFCFTPLEI